MVDKSKIKELKKLAKEDTNALIELAELYGGVGCGRGLKFYLKAAKLNNVRAQSILATYYYSKGMAYLSIGVEYAFENRGSIYENMTKAKEWCEAAIRNGDKSITAMLSKVKEILFKLD